MQLNPIVTGDDGLKNGIEAAHSPEP